jgi:hypothetical protein
MAQSTPRPRGNTVQGYIDLAPLWADGTDRARVTRRRM